MNYLYAILAIILALAVIKFILKLSVKIFMSVILTLAICITALVIFVQPKMHKEFNFNIIERVLKINNDGSTSVIETTTTTKR